MRFGHGPLFYYFKNTKLFSCQIISQVLLANTVAGEVFIGILVVSPDVLANPTVTLDPLASRAALVESQRNIIFPGHIPGQGNISLIVSPKHAAAAGVTKFDLNRSILVGRHSGTPGDNPRALHLVDRPAVADNKVGVGLVTVSRPLHEASGLLTIGPTTNIVQNNIL